MSDVVRVLMERCEENVNSERVHTNKKFRLKRTHTNEILDQLVSRMGTTIAKLTSSFIADVVLKLDSYLFSPWSPAFPLPCTLGWPRISKYHSDFQPGIYIYVWDKRNRLRPNPANRNEYPPSAHRFNYTKEIWKNTREIFKRHYFEILSCKTYSKVI